MEWIPSAINSKHYVLLALARKKNGVNMLLSPYYSIVETPWRELEGGGNEASLAMQCDVETCKSA